MAELDVLAVGHAVVDVLSHADDEFLAAHGLEKGSARLVDADEAERLYADMGPGIEVSGGSAANTAVGVASLGAAAGFVGKVRDDQLGRVFAHDIEAVGVEYANPFATAGPPTGRCLVLVTPDAQRTMSTFLGVASQLSADDVDADLVARAKVTFVEGYLWGRPELVDVIRRVVDLAHGAGRLVAFTLSATFLVEQHRDAFLDFVERDVDVLFGNEEEVAALLRPRSEDDAVEGLAKLVDVAALTLGPRGSVVVAEGDAVHVPAEPAAAVVDTTGAGDLYASGFLVGLTRGLAPEQWGRLGGIAAAEVISHVGARPQVPLLSLARDAGVLP